MSVHCCLAESIGVIGVGRVDRGFRGSVCYCLGNTFEGDRGWKGG